MKLEVSPEEFSKIHKLAERLERINGENFDEEAWCRGLEEILGIKFLDKLVTERMDVEVVVDWSRAECRSQSKGRQGNE